METHFRNMLSLSGVLLKKKERLFRVNLVCISEMSLMIVHLQDKHNFVSVQQLKQEHTFCCNNTHNYELNKMY